MRRTVPRPHRHNPTPEDVPSWVEPFDPALPPYAQFPWTLVRLRRGYLELHASFHSHPWVIGLTDVRFRGLIETLAESSARRCPPGLPLMRVLFNSRRKHLREAVFERDGRACVRCGTTERLTIDHVVPIALGGDNDLSNLQVLCLSCNTRKGARI